MPPRRVNARNVNARNVNAAPLVPQEVSNVELTNTIKKLALSFTNQKSQRVQAHVNGNDGSTAARALDFLRMNPSEFLVSTAARAFEVMQVTWNDRVQLAPYQLEDVAHIWYTQW